MTKTHQKRLLRTFMRSVTNDLLRAVDFMPEEWDGFELRWFAAEYTADSTIDPLGGDGPRRKRAYKKAAFEVRSLMRR